MSNLDTLEQYKIERSLFVELFGSELDDLLWDVGYNETTDSYKIFRDADEFYILHLNSGTMINWYKHIGRTNTCNKDLSIDEYKLFFKTLIDELKGIGE